MEEFINLKQGNMSLEDYSLKFSTFSRYASSLVSNPRYEMSHFVKGVADLVMEKCRTAIIHDDMTLCRLMLYAQSIEESKLRKMARSLKIMVLIIKSKVGLRKGLTLKKILRVLR